MSTATSPGTFQATPSRTPPGIAPGTPDVTGFFDPATATVTYVLADPGTGRCAIIDSVLDFDLQSGRTSRTSADAVLAHVRERGLGVEWVLETHVHADHLSAAPYMRAQTGGRIGIGGRIPEVQTAFRPIFGDGTPEGGRPFDRLFADGESFKVGGIPMVALHTPGHTPACTTYVAGIAPGQVAFVGDTLFMPDFGTARCDFPGGDAHQMWRSIQRILALPPTTRIMVGHDYPPAGRGPAWESTVAEQRERNLHLQTCADEDAFVAMRTARDRTLKLPALMLPSVQVNLRAGEMPEPEPNGRRYLKIPLDTF